MIASRHARSVAILGLAGLLSACTASSNDAGKNVVDGSAGDVAPQQTGVSAYPTSDPTPPSYDGPGGGGVCPGGEYLPTNVSVSQGWGCLEFGCGDGTNDAVPLEEAWIILWACDSGGSADAGPDGGGQCGVTPPDFDACLQWTCNPDGHWSGRWHCFDPVACGSCEAGATDCKAFQPAGSCLDSHGIFKDMESCYCDPKQGGWLCAVNDRCVDAGSPDLLDPPRDAGTVDAAAVPMDAGTVDP
jgi:hypothetical protein